MRLLTWFLITLTLLGYTVYLQAAELNSYSASVAIDSKTAADNPEVLKQGLLQVLTNVSGNTELDKLPAIQQALKTPESYLLKYTVQIVEPAQKISLQTYAPGRIESLLKSAGLNTAQTEVVKEAVNIIVRGVNSLSEYASLQEYLEGLNVVKNLKLTKLKGDVLRLSFNIKSSRADLLNTLNQDNKLILENQNNLNSFGPIDGEPLQFRWNT